MTVEELIDKECVCAVMRNFATGVDRMDWDLVRGCFHDGAVDMQSFPDGEIDRYLAELASERSHGGIAVSCHHLGNQMVESNGDLAVLESSVVAYNQRRSSSLQNWIGLRYLDLLERRSF